MRLIRGTYLPTVKLGGTLRCYLVGNELLVIVIVTQAHSFVVTN